VDANAIDRTDVLPGYAAAREAVAYRVLAGAGCVRLGGATRFDYLQRQTTNDLGLLSAARALPNILTSATGRAVELFTMLEDGEDYLLLTPPERGAALADFFQKRIFFNDQVSVEDESAAWVQFEICGPKAAQALQSLGIQAPPKPDAVAQGRVDDWKLRAIGQLGTSWRLLAEAGATAAIEAALAGAGAAALNDEAAELLRIEAGLPGAPELNGDYTPFELGLGDWVSATKGCYTGQEVLARQVTYDKVTRGLARLALDQAAEQGAEVVAEGKVVGKVTAVAMSPTLGMLALAVLRKPHNEAGSQVMVKSKGGSSQSAVVIPFPNV